MAEHRCTVRGGEASVEQQCKKEGDGGDKATFDLRRRQASQAPLRVWRTKGAAVSPAE